MAALTETRARELICELCRHFYDLGWATGTGGGISLRTGDTVLMAPSGVQKEKLAPSDIFKLNLRGEILEKPEGGLVVSACKPLFMHAYTLRNAGAVLHSHSQNAALASLLYNKEFRITGIEMLKGIRGHGVFDMLSVPIIENTAHESELADSLGEAVKTNPKTYAILVRGHGVYVWGKDWIEAKIHAESYDYLFRMAVKMKRLGLDPEKGGRNA